MNISGPFIRRPIGTTLLAIGLFVVGMICYSLLGVAALPNIQFPAIFVQAQQSGADASTMASTVAAPLERHLGQVPGVESMRSNSSEGSTFVLLFFQNGTNIDAAARDVQSAINAAQPDLPTGLLNAPSYQKANPNDDPVIVLALTSDTVAPTELYNVADSILAQRLRQQEGIASVDIAGSATPAIRVDVNLRALNAMGLSPDQLRNALTAANVTSPQGFLTDGFSNIAVTATDSLHTAEEFGKLVIAVKNSVPIRLSDIAHVYDGQQDAYQAAWFNGKPGILMYVYRKSDANVIETVDRIKSQIPTMQAWLPAGVKLHSFFDGTPTIRASLHEVQATLLISLGMVIMTMALFLRRLARRLDPRAAPAPAGGHRLGRHRRQRDAGDSRGCEPARAQRDGPVAGPAAQCADRRQRHLATGLPHRRLQQHRRDRDGLAAYRRRLRQAGDRGQEQRADPPV